MKTNLVPAGSVAISKLNVGDFFISIATYDLHKGERAIYIKVDMNGFIPRNPNRAWEPAPYYCGVNLATGHVRKFNLDFLVEPCPDACVNV